MNAHERNAAAKAHGLESEAPRPHDTPGHGCSDDYCAARDSLGSIRLNGGAGLLVADAAHTITDVRGWFVRSQPGRFREQYRAALRLMYREQGEVHTRPPVHPDEANVESSTSNTSKGDVPAPALAGGRLDRYAAVLRAHGSEPGSSIHSWRCEYPDRYGACDCVAELASDLVAVADAEQAELRAEVVKWRAAALTLEAQAKVSQEATGA